MYFLKKKPQNKQKTARIFYITVNSLYYHIQIHVTPTENG